MAIFKRNIPGNETQDTGILHNIEHNRAAGTKKTTEIGPHLVAIPYLVGSVTTYTTNLTTARPLPVMGASLAIYNKDTAVHSITLGEDGTVTALAAGVTDAAGHVGVPCAPGQWTPIACSFQNWVISDSAQLCVFLVDDDSSIKFNASK